MKIIAKVKDYYDYVGKIYGEDEADPIIYKRLDLIDDEYKKVELDSPFTRGTQVFGLPDIRNDSSFQQLIICGYVFTVYKESYIDTDYKLLTKEQLEKIIDERASRYFYRPHRISNYYQGEYVKQAADICKVAGQPVIVFAGTDYEVEKVYIDRRIPNLGELGIPAFFKPEELFQMIEQFISNEIRTNPDSQPPVGQDNNNKIVSHGFDLKTSFRHRK